MFNLPPSTEFNRLIQKQKIYEHAKISPALEKKFAAQVDSIRWLNKIAPYTINLAIGRYVAEIEIIEVRLRAESLDEKILRLLDKAIPNQTIFVLSRGEQYQMCAAYSAAPTVKKFFRSDWSSTLDLSPALIGLSLDDVYENFFRLIIGSSLIERAGESFSDALARYDRMCSIDRKVETLRRKIYAEKQFNRQLEMRGELKILQAELERLRRGQG